MEPVNVKVRDYLPTVDRISTNKDLIIKRLNAAKFQARLTTIAYSHDEFEWSEMSVNASNQLDSGVSQGFLSILELYFLPQSLHMACHSFFL